LALRGGGVETLIAGEQTLDCALAVKSEYRIQGVGQNPARPSIFILLYHNSRVTMKNPHYNKVSFCLTDKGSIRQPECVRSARYGLSLDAQDKG